MFIIITSTASLYFCK